MKKIGIDARLYSQTGVGTYLRNLLYQIDNNPPKGTLFYVYLTDTDFEKAVFKNKNLVKRRANYRWHSLSEQISFLLTLYRDNLDLVHFTYFSYPVFYFKKFVATVHDATPLLFKTGRASTRNPLLYRLKHFFFRIILKTQVSRALKIITPTESVKKELKGIYGEWLSEKTRAIHEGVSAEIMRTKPNQKLKGKYGKFFLYVGNFYPHKNVDRLIEAYMAVKTDIKLVLAGPNDYFTARLIRTLKSNKRVIVVKNPSISDLVFLYKNAESLVHPSLSEGFGLPVVEAMYFGCPVIASDIPVFREILGDGYVAFDPKKVEDISAKIRSFIERKPIFDYANSLKRFSFSRMTAETLEVYGQALGL